MWDYLGGYRVPSWYHCTMYDARLTQKNLMAIEMQENPGCMCLYVFARKIDISVCELAIEVLPLCLWWWKGRQLLYPYSVHRKVTVAVQKMSLERPWRRSKLREERPLIGHADRKKVCKWWGVEMSARGRRDHHKKGHRGLHTKDNRTMVSHVWHAVA